MLWWKVEMLVNFALSLFFQVSLLFVAVASVTVCVIAAE